MRVGDEYVFQFDVFVHEFCGVSGYDEAKQLRVRHEPWERQEKERGGVGGEEAGEM